MRAGRLDRRISIEQSTPSTDAMGEPVDGWAELAAVWAEVRFQTGREVMAGGGEQAEADVMFFIRYRSDVTTDMRIAYAGDTYDIIRPPREIGRQAGLEILARAPVA